MSIRRDEVTRVNEARKSSLPTIGRGKPLNSRGFEGDLTFRRTPDGLKLYIKANHQWHGVKVGESFDGLEKVIKEVKSKVDTIKQFRLPSTYSVTGDFTLDASGDISLDADGGEIYLKDNGTTFGVLTSASGRSTLQLYEAAGASTDDHVYIQCQAKGKTIIQTTDAAGSDADFTLNVDGDITLNSVTGVFIAQNNSTEFSVANSAYAGMIIGYTRIQNNSTTNGDQLIAPDATLTVLQTAQGTDVSVVFVAPPSGNVEIQFSCLLYASSRTLEFALSDNASFSEIHETHTYDRGAQSSDETDLNSIIISFAVTGLTAGTSYTYFIGAAETSSGTSSIYHGRHRSTGNHYPPIIVKAIALPGTITTGE